MSRLRKRPSASKKVSHLEGDVETGETTNVHDNGAANRNGNANYIEYDEDDDDDDDDDDEEEDDSKSEDSRSWSILGSRNSIAGLTGNSKTGMLITSGLIVLVGLGAAAMILGFGISGATQEQQIQFEKLAGDLIHQFEMAMGDYVATGLWLHQACRSRRATHQDFRVVYEYLLSSGLQFQAISFAMNVTSQQERSELENETRAYVQEFFPQVQYHGFVGFEPDVNNTLKPGPRSEADFYFPVHFIEPMEDIKNQAALDFDIYTSPPRRQAMDQALETWEPALTERVKLLQEGVAGTEAYAYSVILMHPGIRLSNEQQLSTNSTALTPTLAQPARPRDLGVLAIRIPEILVRAHTNLAMEKSVSLYLYDSTDSVDEPPFLGGALLHAGASSIAVSTQAAPLHSSSTMPPDASTRAPASTEDDDGMLMTMPPEPQLSDIHQYSKTLTAFTPELERSELRQQVGNGFILEKTLPLASRKWSLVVVAAEGEFAPNLNFVILAATMIFVACICLALWIYSNQRRIAKMNQLRAQAEAEKAKMMIVNAREAAKHERELNDFLAHEVRNPLSAAISACSFVKAAVHEANPMSDEASQLSVREDTKIIDASLQFINDLLRNMLDMHRASSNQLNIDFAPVDVLRDVLEPVASMLYVRGHDFEVTCECPENTAIMTDRLRLKQVCMNLGRNSAKFVSKGFIRLRVEVIEGMVYLYIEDSGPGIPLQKRRQLFAKFQESLDSLNQGTGMGLCLCKKLVELMNGSLWLDDSYDSGVPGCPGARFVINLNTGPLCVESIADQAHSHASASVGKSATGFSSALDDPGAVREFPDKLSVLFVDDDLMLRKLFGRALKRTFPNWTIREAANGETALRLVETEIFHVIFLDQYMSSADKQLLGTETARALRAAGIKSIICGLSANDMEKPFLKAGANCFCVKPFPCEADELRREVHRVLSSGSVSARALSADVVTDLTRVGGFDETSDSSVGNIVPQVGDHNEVGQQQATAADR